MALRSLSVLSFFLLTACGSAEVSFTASKTTALSASQITIGTYNVENFWDGNDSDTPRPYDDYAGKSSNWIKDNMVQVKAAHIADAIRMAGSPDILGVEEIESAENNSESLDALKSFLEKQGYKYFALGQQNPNNPVAVTTGVISKFPIVKNDRLDLPGDESDRDPQVVTIDLGSSQLRFYVSHWKSKRGSDSSATEQRRIAIAKLIHDDMESVRAKDSSIDCILVGDFNSNYNETQKEHISKSGAVEGLHVTGDERMMLSSPTDRLYNLWFDLPAEKRGSYAYDDDMQAIDNIVITDSLFDSAGLQYVPNSVHVVGLEPGTEANKKLLNADGSALRWQVELQGPANKPYTFHTGIGYSDHLPLVAKFNIIAGKGSSEKIKLSHPSTTEFGPDYTAALNVPVCNLAESVDLTTVDLSKSTAFGTCVKLTNGNMSIAKTGRFGVKVDVNGSPLQLSMTYAFGRNKDFLRNTVQRSAGKKLDAIVGRIGYSDGLLTVFANEPKEISFR